MFTNSTVDENKLFVNPVQESPGRLSVYSINRCEDQVIGFEFISRQYETIPRCHGTAIVNLCVPVEILQPIIVDNVEFYATDDPCFKDWIVEKKIEPDIEIQRNDEEEVTGILIRFFKNETCCYPLSMAFKLYAYSDSNCKYLLSNGLLIFR